MTLFDKNAPDQDAELEALATERFTKDGGEIDIEALKKSWIHSQKHIRTVEADAAVLREDNIKRLSYEDLLAKLKQPNDSNDDPTDITEPDGNRNTQNVDIDALLESKLNAKLTQYQQSSTQSENRAFVKAELEKAWGDNYVDKLVQKTKELNLTQDYINDLAGSNPKAILAILDAKPVAKQPNVSAPRSSVTIRGGTKTMSKYEEYQSVRKTDPKKYSSPAFQMEMLKVANEMGDKFYSKS